MPAAVLLNSIKISSLFAFVSSNFSTVLVIVMNYWLTLLLHSFILTTSRFQRLPISSCEQKNCSL